MSDIVPKIKVQIATAELGTDNNDIKLSTSFELKVMGSNVEQNTLMNNIKKLIVDHNEKIQGVQKLPLDKELDNDFPTGGRDAEPVMAGAGKRGKAKRK